MDGCTRGDANDEAFVVGEFASNTHGLLRADRHDAINNGGIIVLGDEVGTYALYAMRRGCASTKQGRLCWFYGNGEELRVMCLETSGSAAKSSASTNGGNEDIHLSVGVVPNLMCCSKDMRFGVGWI